MGQKVNPIAHRLGVYNNWKSKWFAKGKVFQDNLLEDWKARDFILKKMGPQAGISEIIIERGVGRISIVIYTARPGILIGRGGKQLEMLRDGLAREIEKKFKLEIVEVKKADMDANVVAQSIGMQLSKRMQFRRVAKQTVQKVIGAGALGVRIRLAGRLDGAEIARKEVFSEGSVPLSTLRSDIDFGVYHAPTTFGVIGVKVWINKGEKVKAS